MKKQILLNQTVEGCCPTVTAGYYKYGVATLVAGNFGTTGGAVLEIEEMQKAINTDANGNAKAIRACYGQCGYDSVFRGTGQGITGVMEEVEPKIAASRGRGEGWKQQLEINESGTSNTITSVAKNNYVMEQDLRMEGGCLVDKDGKRYRIRKLTPRETFRLMDVKDEDIDKIQQAGIAKTNQYKLAGNSIVVSCMYHIFRKLFVEKGNENQQLELF